MVVPSVAEKRPGRRTGSSWRAAVAGFALGLAFAGPGLAAEPVSPPDGADATAAAAQMRAWVLEAADNQALPFLIIDKTSAQVFAFDAGGRPLGAASVLLGLARGDVSPPGIGDLPLSAIGPELRITPAGRFVASIGRNIDAKSILWIDYASALSLHPVVTGRAVDRRLERLASATVDDNRISYGCINVPAAFFAGVIQPAFSDTLGVVYILPETLTLSRAILLPAATALPASF